MLAGSGVPPKSQRQLQKHLQQVRPTHLGYFFCVEKLMFDIRTESFRDFHFKLFLHSNGRVVVSFVRGHLIACICQFSLLGGFQWDSKLRPVARSQYPADHVTQAAATTPWRQPVAGCNNHVAKFCYGLRGTEYEPELRIL